MRRRAGAGVVDTYHTLIRRREEKEEEGEEREQKANKKRIRTQAFMSGNASVVSCLGMMLVENSQPGVALTTVA